jgi:beta-lactamase class A
MMNSFFRTSLLIATMAACFKAGPVLSHEDLSDRTDPGLQAGLEQIVHDLNLGAMADEDTLAIALVDLSDAEPRVALLNGHEMIYAASLPKIAILLGAAVALDEGSLEMDPALEKDLHDMIRVSCNPCATRVLDRIGRQRLLDVLESPDYHFYDRQSGGGLWVGKPYGPESAYRRDPVEQISHGATVFQAARFYYLLHRRELVSPEQSQMMLDALASPEINHKFVKGLAVYEDLEVFRKSGSWKQFHADSALVQTADHVYIMVALVEDPGGGELLEKLAPRLHELITAD